MKHPIYLAYGLALLMGASLAEYRGWTPFGPKRVDNIPRSVRDNPGIYRSIYSGYSRYSGGK